MIARCDRRSERPQHRGEWVNSEN